MRIICDSQEKADELIKYLATRFCVEDFGFPYEHCVERSCEECFLEVLKDKIEIQES